MVTDKLESARIYEKEAIEYNKIPAYERPAFHATGTIGWINDPNGFGIYTVSA